MVFRHRPRLVTAELFGEELSASISAIYSSPEQQAAAREEAERLERDKRQQEAQLLKEICDGADNGVYGKEGRDVAVRFAPEVDGKRSYYMQLGLRDALHKAGLLKRSARRGR